MSQIYDEEDKQLLERYKDEVAKFREFCIKHGTAECFEETDFTDLSQGFFIALGIGNASGFDPDDPFYDASRLASICRYTLQYWEGQTL